MLILRDGRKLVGVLRSWDQFGILMTITCLEYTYTTDTDEKANLVLQDTVERLYAGSLYADIPRGIFLVRGENVLLLGEIVCLPPVWPLVHSCMLCMFPLLRDTNLMP